MSLRWDPQRVWTDAIELLFFLLCRFCQLLLRGQGFSLQNCHFLFPSDLLSSDYFVLIRWTKATQLTYIPNFPAPTHNKKNMLSYTFIRVTHKHESIMSFKWFPYFQPIKKHPTTVGFSNPTKLSKAYGANAYGFEFACSLWRIGSPVTRCSARWCCGMEVELKVMYYKAPSCHVMFYRSTVSSYM